ncbi:hypothetical protein [Luteibacter sp. Lutesp34]|uniref:hypothetical protein n=1 Tax=Luteibacter sp. Lutesp34 TaxID=3243030 RepID=UPI0039B3B00B
MSILLAFAPFAVFAVLAPFVGPVWGLAAGAAVSAGLSLRDVLSHDRWPKFMELGTFVLFSGLTAFMAITGTEFSVIGVRACVDAGLLAIILLSMAVRHPFTLQYAQERVRPEARRSGRFLRTNYILTAAWALAFAIMVSIELAMLFVPTLSHRLGVTVIVLALFGALRFTDWYPSRLHLPRH